MGKFVSATPLSRPTLSKSIAIAILALLMGSHAHADELNLPHLKAPPHSLLLAQSDGDDAYDPFADYSEFEETMDEEEDINFFRNGRLMTLGFVAGDRGWTDVLGKIYGSGGAFGVFMAYFFDLRFALQFGYLTSDHVLSINGTGFSPISGNVNISDIAFNLKYYFNTQNVTRGLADLNPYILGGFSEVYRTVTISGNSNYAKDSAFAFDFGAGIEIPMMRNRMFFGIQAMYQYIAFQDKGSDIYDAGGNDTGVKPTGDSYTILGVLGINF